MTTLTIKLPQRDAEALTALTKHEREARQRPGITPAWAVRNAIRLAAFIHGGGDDPEFRDRLNRDAEKPSEGTDRVLTVHGREREPDTIRTIRLTDHEAGVFHVLTTDLRRQLRDSFPAVTVSTDWAIRYVLAVAHCIRCHRDGRRLTADFRKLLADGGHDFSTPPRNQPYELQNEAIT